MYVFRYNHFWALGFVILLFKGESYFTGVKSSMYGTISRFWTAEIYKLDKYCTTILVTLAAKSHEKVSHI